MQMYQGAMASPGLVMGPVRRLQHSGPGLERIAAILDVGPDVVKTHRG